MTAGGITATTGLGSGRAVLNGVPPGPQSLRIEPESLPPFFKPPAPRDVQVPLPGDVFLPVVLPIGANRPNTYMAYGDSITNGDGSSDGSGYRGRLQSMLAGYLGRAQIVNRGVGGTLTGFGARNLAAILAQDRPAYTLLQYGTNDWSNGQCSVGETDLPCPTVNNLRRMVREARTAQSLPLLATLIPRNPDFASPQENAWVAGVDAHIRDAAREEGAVLVDLHQAFLAVERPGRLYADTLHPNDGGYEIMAQAFFRAITRGATPRASGQLKALVAPAGPDRVPGWRPAAP